MATKTQIRARLKALRRKHGLGEFRSSRKNKLKGGFRNKVARRKKSRSSSRGRFKGRGMMALALGSALYGAMRSKVSDALAPLTSKIPLGTVADEVVLGVLAHQVSKRTSGVISDIGKAGFFFEISRL